MGAQGSNRPRVRVAALVLIDGKVVTVRHRAGDRTYHLLPGGGVDYRETLGDALKRELLEETGLEVSLGRPILINDTIDPHGTRHVVNITFTGVHTGGTITQAPQDARVEAVELVEPSRLPELDLRPPLAEAILRALEQGDGFTTEYVGSVFT